MRGGGAKPYRQKGTGNARQGSTNSPHYTGGGIALGPKPRSYAQRTPKKMIKLALRSALSDRASDGKVVVVDEWGFDGPKTKDAKAALAALGVEGRALVVIDRFDSPTAPVVPQPPRDPADQGRRAQRLRRAVQRLDRLRAAPAADGDRARRGAREQIAEHGEDPAEGARDERRERAGEASASDEPESSRAASERDRDAPSELGRRGRAELGASDEHGG